MKISIARDGNVLGEYDESEIPSLARSRVLQPTDLYWQDGLPDWQPLTTLAGLEPWPTESATGPSPVPAASPEPAPAPAPEPEPAPKLASPLPPPSRPQPGPQADPEPEPIPEPSPGPPLALSKKALAGIALALVLVVGGIPLYFRAMKPAKAGSGATPAAATTGPAVGSPAKGEDSQLRAKVSGLQKPPTDLQYENMTCDVQPTESPYATHIGIIAGRELILNHDTHKTDFILDFTVTVGCQDGEWFFDHATGTFHAMSDDKKIEIAEDFHAPNFLRNLIGALHIQSAPRRQPPAQ